MKLLHYKIIFRTTKNGIVALQKQQTSHKHGLFIRQKNMSQGLKWAFHSLWAGCGTNLAQDLNMGRQSRNSSTPKSINYLAAELTRYEFTN
jgi:hypothetical protein